MEQLQAGTLFPQDLPMIEVVRHLDKMWTQDNRRLFAFKEAGVTEVTAKLVPPGDKFFTGKTTRSDGLKVRFNNVSEDGPWVCRICDATLNTWPLFRQHRRNCLKRSSTGDAIRDYLDVPEDGGGLCE